MINAKPITVAAAKNRTNGHLQFQLFSAEETMRITSRSAALLVVLCLMLASCGRMQSEESSRSESAKPEPTQAESKTTPQGTVPATEKETKSQAAARKQPNERLSGTQPQRVPTPAEQKSKAVAAPSETQREVQKGVAASTEQRKPAVTTKSAPANTLVAGEKKVPPKDVVILRGSPIGVVKFEHKLHQERAGNKCETCHHPSKPEKPAKAAQQSCLDCHTKPPQAGMKTGLQGAFHNPMAQAGTCVDCHKTQSAQGKKPPTKCMDCHKKENT